MKSIEEVINDYEKYETFLDDRFGVRLCSFLEKDQINNIGFEVPDEYDFNHKIPWTEEEVLKQLKEDVEFGLEKAINRRGISSSLMFNVCLSWCIILEIDHKYLTNIEYNDYGLSQFKDLKEYLDNKEK